MGTSITLTMNIQWVEPETVWLLQIGGRIPLVLAGGGTVLIDRSILSAVSRLLKRPDRVDYKPERWWLRPLDSDRFVLNPILCALEGRATRLPTFDEFRGTLDEAREVLARGFPKAEVTKHKDSDLQSVFGIVQGVAQRTAAEQAFLLAVAPMLVHRVPRSAARSQEDRVVAAARQAGLESPSLLVLSALSCVYERQDGAEPMIGRRIIKPSTAYTEANAYNAVADIRCLEILASASLFEGVRYGFVTRDRYLAAFWCALGASNATMGKNGWTVTMAPAMDLFPSLGEGNLAGLLARML